MIIIRFAWIFRRSKKLRNSLCADHLLDVDDIAVEAGSLQRIKRQVPFLTIDEPDVEHLHR